MTPDSFATGLMANRRVLLVSLTALAMTSLYYALLLTHSDVSGLRVFERVQRVLPQKLLHDTSSRPIDASYSQNSAISDNRSETLVVASRIFVVSLPSRTDRREQMEYLRTALGLRWNYVDAIGSQSDEVKLIMKQTRRKRKATNKPAFRWPRDIDAISSTTRPIPRAGSELWTVVSALNPANMQGNTVLGNAHTIPTASDPPLACATEDDTTPRFTPGLPEFKILTPAKVAVWDSHISAIRRVVEESSWTSVFSAEDVSIILEDDVDMEWDIRTRLGSVWSSLPAGWDAVFLGEPRGRTTFSAHEIGPQANKPLLSRDIDLLRRSLLVKRVPLSRALPSRFQHN